MFNPQQRKFHFPFNSLTRLGVRSPVSLNAFHKSLHPFSQPASQSAASLHQETWTARTIQKNHKKTEDLLCYSVEMEYTWVNVNECTLSIFKEPFSLSINGSNYQHFLHLQTHRAALRCFSIVLFLVSSALSADFHHSNWRCHCCMPNVCSLMLCVCVCEMREYVFLFISEKQSYVVFEAFDCEVLTMQGVQQTRKQTPQN